MDVVISGTGLFTPKQSISNAELVHSFNLYVDAYNKKHAEEIKGGMREALQTSGESFIEKASGIKQRYVIDKSGIIDPERMKPYIKERSNTEHSVHESALPVGSSSSFRIACIADWDT